MEKEGININLPSVQNEKEKSESLKKYNFYRKPSIKKKPPEVKQTLTSYKRMLKANPLLKYELEGKNLSEINKQLLSSSSKLALVDNAVGKSQPEKQSLQSNFNSGKPLVSNLQRSKPLKNASTSTFKSLTKGTNPIISGNKPKTSISSTSNMNISKQSSVDFNPTTSRFLSSTKLENRPKVQKNVSKSSSNTKPTNTTTKTNSVTQGNTVLNSKKSLVANCRDREKRIKPVRRSLSAQHFENKKGIVNTLEPDKRFTHIELTQSLDDVSKLKTTALHTDISPIAEGSHESSIKFRTPSAYERRSILHFTPRSTTSFRRSGYHPSTPLPSLQDLQKRLNDWLVKRGKSSSTFSHLKSFANQGIVKQQVLPIDEENKENIEVDQDLDKSSWEDLKITVTEKDKSNIETEISPILGENVEHIARAALEDLQKLIQEGYPMVQCEAWLKLIREKYQKLEEEPQYWECRAAIEQSRGNITNAVQCYRTAIVQGAEIEAVDESLDMLLQKFSLLNISTDHIENEKSIRERARIVKDARNVFKSSIIQFAVQERKLKTSNKEVETKLVAIPVRRSTRLSRTTYTSTPGVKLFTSLREMDTCDREIVNFEKNKALF